MTEYIATGDRVADMFGDEGLVVAVQDGAVAGVLVSWDRVSRGRTWVMAESLDLVPAAKTDPTNCNCSPVGSHHEPRCGEDAVEAPAVLQPVTLAGKPVPSLFRSADGRWFGAQVTPSPPGHPFQLTDAVTHTITHHADFAAAECYIEDVTA
jgi:hypothetical protein